MHTQRTRRGAFTLIEMVIVISIIVTLMAVGIPALINSQNQADDFATPNVIFGVHTTCQRNARQLGSAGVIYGFTLRYATGGTISGQYGAEAITPWIIVGTALKTQGDMNIEADFGKTPLWSTVNLYGHSGSPDSMSFWDRYRPAAKVVFNPDTTPTVISLGSQPYIHVAYEPRTGFPHAVASNAVLPDTCTTFNAITDPATVPDRIDLQLWSTKGTPQSRVVIHRSGVCNAHNGP